MRAGISYHSCINIDLNLKDKNENFNRYMYTYEIFSFFRFFHLFFADRDARNKTLKYISQFQMQVPDGGSNACACVITYTYMHRISACMHGTWKARKG